MIRQINKNNSVNFVDDRNVVIGFSIQQQCCEDFDWRLEYEAGGKPISDRFLTPDGYVLEGYRIDPSYCGDETCESPCGISFRFVSEDHPTIRLVIINRHNGYYSHGFYLRDENGKRHDGWV